MPNTKTYQRANPGLRRPVISDGSVMPGRSFSSEAYRYGFNTQEKDDEIYGAGNSYSALYWQYDARIGRRWNIDPIVFPGESGYATFSNNPLYYIDHLGLSPEDPPDPHKEKKEAPIRSSIKNFFGRLETRMRNAIRKGPDLVYKEQTVYRKDREKDNHDVLEVEFWLSETIEIGSSKYRYQGIIEFNGQVTLPPNPIPESIRNEAKTMIKISIIQAPPGRTTVNGEPIDEWQKVVAGSPFTYNAMIIMDENALALLDGWKGPGGNSHGYAGLSYRYFYGSKNVLVKVPRGFLGIRNWKEAVIEEGLKPGDKTKEKTYYKPWR